MRTLLIAASAIGLLGLIALTSQAYALDTEYSNVQAGVRLKILNLGGEMPMLRIENAGRETLAIRSSTLMAVSFWKDNERVQAMEQYGSRSGGPRGPTSASDEVTILPPGANLELPLRSIYFNVKAEGYGFFTDWKIGSKCLPAGKYKARFTTNGKGMTVLDVNVKPFGANFDIPEFEIATKEEVQGLPGKAPGSLVGAAIASAVVQVPGVASERNATLGESHNSRLMEYQLTSDPGGSLANAWVVLRAEPEKHRPAPRGAQAASYPDSRWTVYTDIDGDSVFDAMVKVGPKQHETYILYRNTWIEVGDQMAKFTVGSVARAKPNGTDYIFKGHAWELQKQPPGQ